jgi:hypothetical protein
MLLAADGQSYYNDSKLGASENRPDPGEVEAIRRNSAAISPK